MLVGEDGYLEHSDSEGDWSDVGESIYETSRSRAKISEKEAKRRRAWASDKDPAAAAGRPWPSFPRNVVTKVLGSMLDEMIKYDQTKGGIFSVPVPRDEFPEYYEVVKDPMDYGTMKTKLMNGEYRSAQSMQKDFHLVMKNCLQFNAPDSDIVQEARQQALLRPKLLKDAATKMNLFIAEDGTVFHIDVNGDEKRRTASSSKKKKTQVPGEKEKKRYVRCKVCDACKREDCGECKSCLAMTKFGGDGKVRSSCVNRKCENPQERPLKSKSRGRKKVKMEREEFVGQGAADVDPDESGSDEEEVASPKKSRRIRIDLSKSKERVSSPESMGSEEEGAADNADCYMDVTTFQKEREALDGSFAAAKAHFTKRGPWQLPTQVADMFVSVAKQTLLKMGR